MTYSGDAVLEGFNSGYAIEKYRPDIASQINNSIGESQIDFFRGFVAGSQQYIKERTQSKTIGKLRDITRQIPRPTQKGKDRPDKGFEIDR
ncbi:MAG: hypothetical protein AAFP77_18185 [Bacteroidota bacterium]